MQSGCRIMQFSNSIMQFSWAIMQQAQVRAVWGGSSVQGKKNGIPLYPNLVNLKSNTMKNTLQR